MIEITAWPLAWPIGWPRTETYRREHAKFHKNETKYSTNSDGSSRTTAQKKDLTIADGCERVIRSLNAMSVNDADVVVSTNVQPRLDGMPRSNSNGVDDPGVAVYWKRKGKRQCLAVDRYHRVADNLAAIAATLDAMRAIDRHGGAQILDRAFTGFVALPAPVQPWQVLGLNKHNPTVAEVEEAHRRLAMKHHPDRGGDTSQMAAINAARDAMLLLDLV